MIDWNREALKVALFWQKKCEEYSGGCEDCPKVGNCIPAKELIIQKLKEVR